MATLIPLSDTFKLADGTTPPSGSQITFTLTAPLTDTVTGVVVAADPVIVKLVAGVLSTSLYATNDPTTSPSGVTYLAEIDLGTEGWSFYFALPYNGGPQVLGLLAPADVAPTVTYGLSSIIATSPLSVVTASGVATLSLNVSNFTTDAELTAEATTRATADSAESTARLAGDATSAGLVTSEAATARAAEGANTAAISAEATSRASADSTEASTRAAADTTNASAITAEASTARAAESANATAITTEAGTRATADTTLTTNVATNAAAIVTEASARTTADALLLVKASNLSDVASAATALSNLGGAASSHTHTHTSTTGQTVDDHHAKSHVHSGDGSGTLGTAAIPDLSAVYLPVARLTGGGVLATAGFTLTVPATGTAALVGADNAFSVGQGIRAALGSTANGIAVPWITGDTHPTSVFGALTAGNDQIAVQGNSATGVGVQGILLGAGLAAVDARYAGSATTAPTLLTVRNRTSSAGTTATGGVLGFLSKTSTTTDRVQADLTATWGGSATETSQKALLVCNVWDTAARQAWQAAASGSAPMIGFLGAAAVARPTVTGVKLPSDTVIASLLTALVALGLVTDSTT